MRGPRTFGGKGLVYQKHGFRPPALDKRLKVTGLILRRAVARPCSMPFRHPFTWHGTRWERSEIGGGVDWHSDRSVTRTREEMSRGLRCLPSGPVTAGPWHWRPPGPTGHRRLDAHALAPRSRIMATSTTRSIVPCACRMLLLATCEQIETRDLRESDARDVRRISPSCHPTTTCRGRETGGTQ